ncbi:DUF4178 domain-containing protein [Roseicyclus mahoneyensis]|uniref:Uncharacterized protein DUF4178 n=1 Tax=Roseicyclus mahoneyensis TaxID=164332 RepID=A0A316GAS9_9RHOB|nr:DUF4178 domain-containing protein [Roseicyclus mahoneyensis]PWK57988.1 uncharacterized protein DUF4178 [Roseicyclus mahoneyensis]
MSRAQGLSSINCTQCGAGLSVLGGGRVLTQVCGYCGSVLDAQDNYKVLTSIGKRDHPDSPVQIGMTLTYEGVEFTVIGTIGKVERWKGGTAAWVEHQVFSPTHGYAWLTWESGHFTFSRKIRDFNMGQWVSSAGVEIADSPPVRHHRGQRYKYYETSTSEIDFMEGEFNWVPELGETTTAVVLLGPDAMLSLRDGKTEREVEMTTLLPRDATAREMGATLPPGAESRHPLSPYQPFPEEAFARRIVGLSAIAAFVLALVFSVISGPRVLDQQQVPIGQAPASFAFNMSNTAQIASLRLDTDVSNDWVVIGAQITNPDGTTLVEGGRLVQYYSGRDSDGSWSEGNRGATLRFRAEQAGTHQITLGRAEGTGGTSMSVRIDEGKATSFWLFVVSGLFVLGWIYLKARRAIHDKFRFAGSDWHEE